MSPAIQRRSVRGQGPSANWFGVPLSGPTRRSCKSGSTRGVRPQARAMGAAVSRARRMAEETIASGFSPAR